ncbi:hypothetical protein OSB04_020082 [Centaurea solstitialis]|uniref:CCHC-type domain-containing protein n=1 Tax=Centaurea solstitialis TaxID=347529 RepID=A0AA38ST64_9ASTR|nr:hypothetical protein OSB04_020082 [Centaurea solstitialis]
MVDDKPIMEQVHELQVLVNKLNALSIPLVELFQVGAIIAKLPPSWKDFSKCMMHRSEDISLDDLLKHLRIEKETRNRDKRVKNFGPKKQSFKKPGNQKPKFNNKPKKFGSCHVCGETGHYARECKDRKSGPVANAVEEVANMVANMDLGGVYMISSLTQATATRGWFVDTGATIHICGQRRDFNTYRPVPAGTHVVCVDGHRADVLGIGDITLWFKRGRTVVLSDTLHVSTISKGLVSADKFDKGGFKLELENGRIEISRGGAYVGKAVNVSGMYRLVLESDGEVNHVGSGSSSGSNDVTSGVGSNNVMFPFANEVNISGRKPEIDYMKVWGCVAYYRTPDPKRSKLGDRAIKSIFVGYAMNSVAYRFLDNESGVTLESRDADFFEDKFLKDSENTNPISVPSTSRDVPEPSRNIEEPRRSTRTRKEKILGDDFVSFLVEWTQKKVTREVIFAINFEDDPKTFSEAMSSRDAHLWKEAINDEMDSILGNKTWELADLPKGKRSIGSKWIFKRKYHPDGSISAYKARLVAKGYRQREGIDYFDTYAPVARISFIRTLIAISALKGLYIHKMDVKTDFLNGYLNEEIYLEQPEGFVMPGHEDKVCRLIKSLYGLKQAPKQWHERFDTTVTNFGFRHNDADRCIYSKCTSDYTVVICLYVDDMLIISTDLEGISETKKYLSFNFKMKDLREVDTILGIKEFNTPFDSCVKLGANSGRAVAQLEYASAIGSMMYAMHCTRPDIAFVVSKVKLTYMSSSGILEGYSDASWIDQTSDSKSTSGWIFTLAGGAISWASKRQTCIAHSTMEAEFIALAAAGKEVEWFRDNCLRMVPSKLSLSSLVRTWQIRLPNL